MGQRAATRAARLRHWEVQGTGMARDLEMAKSNSKRGACVAARWPMLTCPPFHSIPPCRLCPALPACQPFATQPHLLPP